MALNISKKIQLYYWISKAFLTKHYRLILISLIVGIGCALIITKIFPYLPKSKPHFRIGLVGQYYDDQLPNDVLNLMSNGLTTILPDGQAGPGLASSWTVSNDGLIYTFILKDNLYWQDGTLIKASEINYNFKDVKSQVVNDKILKFTLNEPYTPFPLALNKIIFKKNNIGTGKYKLYKLKKNGNIVDSLFLISSNEDITIKFYPTLEALINGFKIGEVDILKDLLLNPFTKDWQNNIKVQAKVRKDRYIGLFLNNQDNLLGNKNLRQALNYSLKTKPKDDTRAIGPLNPNSWAYNADIKAYDFNAENALKLFNKFKEEKNESIELKIATSQAFLSTAQEIKHSWEETLGIKVNIEIINNIPQNYQIFLGMQEIPPDPDQYPLWHSTRTENITHFNDVKVDKLLEDGRRILNKDIRKEKYLDFQRFLLEESPVVFISHPVFYTIIRSSVNYQQ